MLPQPVMPVFVAWNTRRWMPIGLGSFRRHFPSWKVLIVDNNPVAGDTTYSQEHELERAWLRNQRGVILISNPGPSRTHGAAIDRAFEWCRASGVPYLLHLEPDCLITGTQWYRNLCQGLDKGAWMSGSHRKEYGPVHPTPSLWRVNENCVSFDYASRLDDEQHPRFSELFRRDWLLHAIQEAKQDLEFWRTTWDTGQKAWFYCAAQGKDFCADDADDFHHYWFGSNVCATEKLFESRPELKKLSAVERVAFRESFPGHPVSPSAASLRNLLLEALRGQAIKRAILLGCPRHANTGDLLLLLGSYAAVTGAGIEIDQALGWPELPKSVPADTAILLHGGGNFGDLYPEEMEFRLKVCRTFRSHRVIWLPQSIEYRSSAAAAKQTEELGTYENVEIWLRDAVSLAKAMAFGLKNVRLVPDAIFGLQQTPGNYWDLGERLEIRRQDQESQGASGMNDLDWLLPGVTMAHGPNEAWDHIAERFQRVRLVVTDRLHAHLVCVLSNIPNVLVADKYGKNQAMYRTWTHLHPRSEFATTWSSVVTAEHALHVRLQSENLP